MNGDGNGFAEGAFVQLDLNKLTSEQWYLMGAKEALERWMQILMNKARENEDRPPLPEIIMEIVGRIGADRDDVANNLTRSATKTGAAKMNNAYGKKIQ